MYKEISKSFIIQTLKNYQLFSKQNNEKFFHLFDQINQRNDPVHREWMMMEASLSSNIWNPIGNIQVNAPIRDITKIYRDYKNIADDELRSLVASIAEISHRQESMNRIMVCYHQLDPKESDVLRYFYIEGNSFKAGAAICQKKYQISFPTAKRWRSNAIQHILDQYNSPLTTAQILMYSLRKEISSDKKYR